MSHHIKQMLHMQIIFFFFLPVFTNVFKVFFTRYLKEGQGLVLRVQCGGDIVSYLSRFAGKINEIKYAVSGPEPGS